MMKSLTLRAPAKINLYLDVINRRRDGYHNIETIFQKIDLCDRIKVCIIKKGISLYCRYPGVPSKKANLAYKAAELMKKKFALDAGIGIYLEKVIPPAAGLGGGSSDAACVITAINRLFRLDVTAERLIKIAGEIGADLPFFVSGYNCALGTGIGDKLKEIRHSRLFHILLLMPRLKLYTKSIYSKVVIQPRCSMSSPSSLSRAEKRRSLPLTKPGCSANMLARILSRNRRYGSITGLLYNRLEDVVLPAYPIVREAKEVLSSYNPEGALLSGSGPCVFAVFSKRKEAIRAKARIKRDGRWQLFLTRTV